MNALLDRVHNFIVPLLRGEDHVCSCSCGRHQAYHVIPYHGTEMEVDPKQNHFITDTMTQQEMDVITGLLLGLCISWFLWWLDGVCRSGLKYWRESRMNCTCIKNTEDCRANMVHGVYHNVTST